MGYSRNFELVLECDLTVEARGLIMDHLKSSYGEADIALTRDGDTYESCRWYSYDKDMKSFSVMYPNVFFILEGKGEENGDAWRNYYQDGKGQRCEARYVYPDYKENLMV